MSPFLALRNFKSDHEEQTLQVPQFLL